MRATNQTTSGATVGPRWHAETFTSRCDGGTINVACDCAVERDHRFGDPIEPPNAPNRHLPGSTRRPTPEAEAAFSPRELRVLDVLLDGYSTAHIATRTGTSINTVKTHLKSVYRKLGATNRAQAIEAALSRKLLT